MTDYAAMKDAGYSPEEIWKEAGKRLSRGEQISLVRSLFDLSFEEALSVLAHVTHGEPLESLQAREFASSRLEDVYGLFWSMQVVNLHRRGSNIVAELGRLRGQEQELSTRLLADGVDELWVASCRSRSPLAPEFDAQWASEPFVWTVQTNLLLASNGVLDHTSSKADVEELWHFLLSKLEGMYRAVVLASGGTPSNTKDLFTIRT